MQEDDHIFFVFVEFVEVFDVEGVSFGDLLHFEGVVVPGDV